MTSIWSHIKHDQIKLSLQLTNVGPSQQVRHKTRTKNKHTCKLINTINIINAYQQNEPVEIWDRVKYCQINKCAKKRDEDKE